MRLGWFAVILGIALATLAGSAHAARPVTVFLERNGRVVSDDVRIPRFGGGDRAWNGIVACVREQFAPFQIDIVDQKPARGQFITAVVGGRASQLGLDNRWTNGVGPHTGRVIPNAIVFVFSKVGTGERDVDNLCSVTAHEVAHAIGLDHTYKCGDMMSYFLDRCGKRRFMDTDSPCGEDEPRRCAGGARTQNSYRRLGELVGFRESPDPELEDEEEDEWDEAAPADPYEYDEYEADDYELEERAPQRHDCGRRATRRSSRDTSRAARSS
jgi:hypothetical protein